jgi:hypothetical protein
MLRTEVIQQIIDRKQASRYLEIGVNNGDSFFPLEIAHKVAVDPCFAFSPERKLEWMGKNPSNATAEYIDATSDDFFANTQPINPFDVAFIDGLHTYEQSLKDVLNTLENLNENGVIVMHDCKPPHVPAACPAPSLQAAIDLNVPGWDGIWCGDVWKTICHLRIHHKDLRVFVLDCDFGLGVVMKGKSDLDLNLSQAELDKMTYDDVVNGKENFLNLKDENYLFEFLEAI